MAYVRAVHAAGGRAVLIAPDDPGVDVLERLDALVLTGGSDVDPALYGEPVDGAVDIRPDRDRSELLLLRGALVADLPVLAICRGAQLMCVAYGGRLYQHLPDALGHDGHRPPHGVDFGEHPVRLAPGSACHTILGDRVTVNSLHHQGVADPGRLTPTGWSDGDDLIEAVEDPARRFAIGVQWHPEAGEDHRLFEALVVAARERGWPRSEIGVVARVPG
jgi:putative glutamine amidotransferase